MARGPHLQCPRRAATSDRHTRQRREQLRRHPRTSLVAMHGDVGDVCLAGHASSGDEHQPAVSEHGAAAPRDDVVAAAGADLSQLVVEDVGAPGPWVRLAFDRHHLADVARPHRFEDDRPADGPVEYAFQDAHGRRSAHARLGTRRRGRSRGPVDVRRREGAGTGRGGRRAAATPRAAPWRGPAARVARRSGRRRRRTRSGSRRRSPCGSATPRRRRTASPGCERRDRRPARRPGRRAGRRSAAHRRARPGTSRRTPRPCARRRR